MKKTDRFVVYFAGFIIGMVMVSFLMQRKEARQQASTDPWIAHNAAMVDAGARQLPEGVPDSILNGRMIDYGQLPEEGEPAQHIWLLNFDESYPYVRVVENVKTGEVTYMAADQILLTLADGVDVIELKPALDELGLRLRMFNRKGRVAVLGVLHTGVSAVPDTLEALKPWAEFYSSAEPDWILFR